MHNSAYKRSYTGQCLPPNNNTNMTIEEPTITDDISACLGTVLVHISATKEGPSMLIRGFCDTGSQVNLITEACAQALKLTRNKTRIPIGGVGAPIMAHGVVTFRLSHRTYSSQCINVKALIVHKISGLMPDYKFDSPFEDKIDNGHLADPSYNVPGHINLLLGAGVWSSIVQDQLQHSRLEHMYATAQLTHFGWVIFGQYTQVSHLLLRSCHTTTNNDDAALDQMLVKYWNSDAIPQTRQWTPDEQRAEEIFVNTHQRDQTGRYIVRLPRDHNAPPLGDSRKCARACFFGIEKRLHRDHKLYAQYKAVFDDYRARHHMVLAPAPPPDKQTVYYLPHHPINAAIAGTPRRKFRVVFNASAPSDNGTSLNDQQLAGPKLQDDLVATFMRFRMSKYGMTADVRQMFRQVKINPIDWNYQRVFWRDSPADELREYIITVVCWGMKSAGFNAVRVLRQMAIENQDKWPIGADITLSDFYFDDMLSGRPTEDELCYAYQEVTNVLASGGFELSKWATNSATLTRLVKKDVCVEVDFPLESGVLGMRWHTNTDELRIKMNIEELNTPDDKLTKRRLMSATAQIFDPFGLVMPVVVIGKILQRNTWMSGIDWDELLPPSLIKQWHEYIYSVSQLDQIRIPRWVQVGPSSTLELHIFTDASELALGAVAYIRATEPDGSINVNLLTARSQVAPINRHTIPRLELKAAVIGVELAGFILSTCQFKKINVTFWTDSTIVIYWLKKDVAKYKPFVANRAIAIRTKSGKGIWQHIDGTTNPADLITRGISAELLKKNTIWWHGPQWLSTERNMWPTPIVSTITPQMHDVIKAEEKANAEISDFISSKSKAGKVVAVAINKRVPSLSVTTKNGEELLVSRRSELSSLLRVTAYVFRFIRACREAVQNRDARVPPLYDQIRSIQLISAVSNIERNVALKYWIKHAQETFFHNELQLLREGKPLSQGNKLIKLRPFVAEDGFVRVGGRLANANIPEGAKHQVILPPDAEISTLLIRNAHFMTVHGGPQIMIAQLRQTIWIHRMRQLVKKTVHQCVTCMRYDQPTNEQLMGQLPASRVNRSEPFSNTGVDFAGPFLIKKSRGRQEAARIQQKAWIVIFVCMATRATHIDVVTGLTIEEFLAAFERFIMRKGRCSTLYSDNGTTFVGTDKELARVLRQWATQLPDHRFAEYNTTWKFITPAAPHKGGIWEAAVKAMKRHLKRALGNQQVTKDELYQLAVHIEGCLNSRPLWPQSDDPNDPLPLTPAHFILGKPILPQPVAENVAEWPKNKLTAWGHRQQLQQKIWHQWREEVLANLQTRNKWYNIKKNLKIGDMVIVKKENMPPATWCLGRVIKIFTAENDGLVRAAIIKTTNGQLERNIDKLILLPPHTADDSVDQTINGGEDVKEHI